MCGFFASNAAIGREDLEEIVSRCLRFRGPDFQSELINYAGWKIYHCRLSIIGMSNVFQQPYFDPNGVLLFNGEIFNYSELAKHYQIEDKGSDTDVLSQLLSQGWRDYSELIGFFSFVYISANGELAACVRDSLGVKPLFYHDDENGITISSEENALAEIFDLKFDPLAIDEYRIFRYPIFRGAYYARVNAVTPGQCLVNGTYFDLRSEFRSKRLDTVSMIETLKSSINVRLKGDAEIGLLFSGGVDSNIINSLIGEDIPKFTAGRPGDFDYEFAARTPDTTLVTFDTEAFKSRLIDMVKLRREPLSVPNEVLLSFVGDCCRKRGIKVLLSGEGADEFFAGYDRIYTWAKDKLGNFDIYEFLELYAYERIENIPEQLKKTIKNIFDDYSELSNFEKVRFFFIKYHLPVLFRRLDFALMYAGVEGREPLATLQVLRSALTFDPDKLMSDNVGKIPLRDILYSASDNKIGYEKKVGFPVDLRHIFNNPRFAELNNYEIWRTVNMEILKS